MTGQRCGGCQGLGAHRRWCPKVVGPVAAQLGVLAERVESCGDTVGPNDMTMSSQLWEMAARLRAEAAQRAEEFREGRTAGR